MFNFDIIVHESTREPWEFAAAGKTWRVPHIADLNLGQKRAADLGRIELVVHEVAEILVPGVDGAEDEWKPAGAAAVDLFLGKYDDEIAAFQVAWLAHAGMEPGESPASSS